MCGLDFTYSEEESSEASDTPKDVNINEVAIGDAMAAMNQNLALYHLALWIVKKKSPTLRMNPTLLMILVRILNILFRLMKEVRIVFFAVYYPTLILTQLWIIAQEAQSQLYTVVVQEVQSQ